MVIPSRAASTFNFARCRATSWRACWSKAVQLFVAAFRVVMKQAQPFHVCRQRQRDRVVHAAVAPAGVPFVFHGVVLRVENQHVRAAEEFDHFLVLAAGRGSLSGK